MTEKTFSLAEALAGQAAMREALKLPPERFAMPAFVGMVSDEIEGMRAAGHTDEAIARLVSDATGQEVSAAEIGANYAPAGERGRD